MYFFLGKRARIIDVFDIFPIHGHYADMLTKFDRNLTSWRVLRVRILPDCDVMKTLIFNISRTTNATKVVDPSFEPKFDGASYNIL